MKKEEIRKAAMSACKNYGYDWVVADFEYDDCDDLINDLKKQFNEKGHCSACIFDGEEPYYALERVSTDDGTDMVDVMEEGEVFGEYDVYRWINLGRIEAWKELFGRKKVGYFCDGYCGFVIDPEMVDVDDLKMRGEVVVA